MSVSEQIYCLGFTAVELRLYLDTHPCDRHAMEKYRSVCARLEALTKEFTDVNDHAGECCPHATKPFPWVID